MENWKKELRFDPIPLLVSSENKAIKYFVKRDLSDEKVSSIEELWHLPPAVKIVKKQQNDGSWKYPGKVDENFRSQEDYNQVETFRNLGLLVEKYGFDKSHPCVQKAAEFIFSKQTKEGDIRGIYGNQYSPNYTAAMFELLIKAGYENDKKIKNGLDWLLTVRQDDGGWAIAMRTLKMKWQDAMNIPEPLLADRSKPYSHMITGVVLRAFALQNDYREREEIQQAGKLLMERFFLSDKYSDRRDKSFWLKFSFPFWSTDLLSALVTLYYLDFTKDDPKIKESLNWFKKEQKENGIWNLKLLRAKDKDLYLWISYLISRTFKQYYTR